MLRKKIIQLSKQLLITAVVIAFVLTAGAQKKKALASAHQEAAKLDEYINAAVRFNHFSGSVLVARNGQPILSKGYGMANYELKVPNKPQTVFRIGSITKQFTTMAVMMLQEQGKLSIKDPICNYLENCPALWQPVTIRNLLTNSSGISNYTSVDGFFEKDAVQPYTSAALVDLFRDKPLEFSPGEKYDYSNSGFHLLGLIIEKASGKLYAEFVQEHIFKPLGMKNSGYDDTRTLIANRASGYEWAGNSFANASYINMMIPYSAGSLYSTTEDLLTWDKALYTDKLVSQQTLTEIFTPFKEEGNGFSYAYGWHIGKRFDRPVVEHSGGINGFSSNIIRFISENISIILLGNNENASSKRISNDLAAIVLGAPYKLPLQPVSDALSPIIATEGVAAALKKYEELKRSQADKYDFSERVLGLLGYNLLRNRKIMEAIEIFKLNARLFPQSFNVYDSLGEAYMMNGDKELATKYYAKSQELNPQNTNAIKMLKILSENN